MQVRETMPDASDGLERWKDVATVTVPPRTKRRTIIEKGLKDANVTIQPGQTLYVRALDEESARETKATVSQPAPQLELG